MDVLALPLETRKDGHVAIVAGVDSVKDGWVAVFLDNGEFAGAEVLRPAAATFEELGRAEIVAIDIPIGYGPRKADGEARRLLAPCAGSSRVFSIPSRLVLETALREDSYRSGLGLSSQTYHLGRRIIHVTALARRDDRFREVHPEISFLAMKGSCLAYAKDTYGGLEERRTILRRHGIHLKVRGEAARVGADDVLDAAAAAWSAQRMLTGNACSLPDPPERRGGRNVAIWY